MCPEGIKCIADAEEWKSKESLRRMETQSNMLIDDKSKYRNWKV